MVDNLTRLMAVKFVKGFYMSEVTKTLIGSDHREEYNLFPFIIEKIHDIMAALLTVVETVKLRYEKQIQEEPNL